MQAEFTRYIRRWKVDRSTGYEIMHKVIAKDLAEKFTMHGKCKGERKPAFKFTRTFEVILNALTCCRDSPGGEAVRRSVDIFLRNHEGMHGRSGSERRQANNNDDDDDQRWNQLGRIQRF